MNRNAIEDAIWREVTEDDPSVRAAFIKHFHSELDRFSSSMAVVHEMLDDYCAAAEDAEDVHLALPAQFMRVCLFMHTQSVRLLTSGHLVPAGNAFRQVLEAVSMALLCSDRELPVAKDFSAHEDYSTNGAVQNLFKKCDRWGVDKDAVNTMKKAEKFFHKFSHVGRATVVASHRASDGAAFIGANFDDDALKLGFYNHEYQIRLNFTAIYPSVFDVIRKNTGVGSPRETRANSG